MPISRNTKAPERASANHRATGNFQVESISLKALLRAFICANEYGNEALYLSQIAKASVLLNTDKNSSSVLGSKMHNLSTTVIKIHLYGKDYII